MFKLIVRCSSVLLAIAIVLTLSSCKGEKVEIENIKVEFWMSNDGGKNYSQYVFEQPAFGHVYLKVRIQIETNSKKASFYPVTLYVGYSEHILAYVIGGTTVEHRNTISIQAYDFYARGVENNDGYTELFIEFMSLGEGDGQLQVEFDKSVQHDNYNYIHPIKFVGSRNSPSSK